MVGRTLRLLRQFYRQVKQTSFVLSFSRHVLDTAELSRDILGKIAVIAGQHRSVPFKQGIPDKHMSGASIV